MRKWVSWFLYEYGPVLFFAGAALACIGLFWYCLSEADKAAH